MEGSRQVANRTCVKGGFMAVTEKMPLEQIQVAADALKRRQPDLTALLTFYESIYQFQEAEKSQVQIGPMRLDASALKQRLNEAAPLAAPPEFRFDVSSCARMFTSVCRLIRNSENRMADSVQPLQERFDQESRIDALCTHLLEGNDTYFNDMASQLQIDKTSIAFVAYHSIRPSVLVCAEQLAAYLNAEQDINNRHCSVCGHLPGMAVLEKEGRRRLSCSFCEHRWAVRRVFCPYCGETDPTQLQYFYSDPDSEYRIDVCDHCHYYLKTIDTRKTDRPVYLPLEHVASLHMDINAQDKGYQSAVAMALNRA